MPNTKKLKFKPLLYTTTMRNPARLKYLLFVLAKFEGKKLNDGLATEICAETIRYGLYRPNRKTDGVKAKWGTTENGCFGETLLSQEEAGDLIERNPQKHKEAGFARGWPSRFATIFDFMKELGIAYLSPDAPIEISPLGKHLLDAIDVQVDQATGSITCDVVHPEYERQVFLQALAKSQRKNPFVRVLNDNVPLILLLQVIQKLNGDSNQNGAGISRRELPLLLFWKNNDADALYQRIVRLRKDCRYSPSDETVCEICVDEIMGGKFKKFKLESIMNEYPDEFIRKMRMTGLFSLRGGGRFVDINKNEAATVDYILRKYSSYPCFSDERAYYDYMAGLDSELIRRTGTAPAPGNTAHLLDDWLAKYEWKNICHEMSILSKRQGSSDDVLRLLDAPLRLEFLSALAIKKRMPTVLVVPHYSADDTGFPSGTAVGNRGDIECFENEHGVLVEVTMLTGSKQTSSEMGPITRHLEAFQRKLESQCLFVAPAIFEDSILFVDFLKVKKGKIIRPYSIDGFLGYLDHATTLYDKALTIHSDSEPAAGTIAEIPEIERISYPNAADPVVQPE